MPNFSMNPAHPLTPEQELFCQLFTDEGEHFGNGIRAYAESHSADLSTKQARAEAGARAKELLMAPKIIKKINELLEIGGFNDLNADKQLSYLMAQYGDLGVKLEAIKEYNKLRQRIHEKEAKTLAPIISLVSYNTYIQGSDISQNQQISAPEVESIP